MDASVDAAEERLPSGNADVLDTAAIGSVLGTLRIREKKL